nr:muramoyltetrapeptide carboxypeptidase [Pseudomonadota bacterium]
QLHFAGVLERQRAVLLGDFSDFELGVNDNGYDISIMIDHARSRFGVPVFHGLPFGHCRDKLTLPVGGHCRLSVREGAARLTFSRYKR